MERLLSFKKSKQTLHQTVNKQAIYKRHKDISL